MEAIKELFTDHPLTVGVVIGIVIAIIILLILRYTLYAKQERMNTVPWGKENMTAQQVFGNVRTAAMPYIRAVKKEHFSATDEDPMLVNALYK